MIEVAPSLQHWGWFFLGLYIALMLFFGIMGMRRVKDSDDFATARLSYGPLFLAFAVTATTASGGTFLGLPGLAYRAGMSGLWYAFVYPLGIYFGLIIFYRAIRRAGQTFGNRSIPEYLGDRFDSDFLRVAVSVFSILLLFYLAAQLLSAAVMFNEMMGMSIIPALALTSLILLVYIVLGGAHADILTDGVQGALMLVLAICVTVLFYIAYGVEGGFSGMIARLNELDPNLTKTLHPTFPLFDSWWDVFAIWVAHIPLGALPHIGNKIWALKHDRDQNKFILISFVFAMILPALTLGGILARAVLGDALLAEGSSPNYAIPALFIAILPSWLAALVGAGVLAAVMSTADGLVVSTSQIFANDIFRRTIAPRWMKDRSVAELDHIGLNISRIATGLVMLFAGWLAWAAQTMNVALLIWAGVGGMMAATTGPIFLGVLWRRSTSTGALAGFFGGGIFFIVLKAGLINAEWFTGGMLEVPGVWLASQTSNPFACATLGSFISLGLMAVVSLFSGAPSEQHLNRVFETG